MTDGEPARNFEHWLQHWVHEARVSTGLFGLSEMISVPSLPSVPVSGIHIPSSGIHVFSSPYAVPETGCLCLTSPGLFSQHWLIMKG